MPQSRKRPGHQYQKPSSIPSSQRTKGWVVWMVLIGLFGLLIGFVAGNGNLLLVLLGGVIGAAVGYFLGKKMEADAKKKEV